MTKNKSFIHFHSFQLVAKDALGVWEKQEGQNNLITVRGTIERCDCGVMRLIPNDKALPTTEVMK